MAGMDVWTVLAIIFIFIVACVVGVGFLGYFARKRALSGQTISLIDSIQTSSFFDQGQTAKLKVLTSCNLHFYRKAVIFILFSSIFNPVVLLSHGSALTILDF
ncbi:hypothetical protein BLNAU_6338 [Blattamonas nauphoetae]|uniref:Uncharacterized protein n=1 Tax=Blattamonas nauphoetae TaxID=2049346 RepID=A0ABQ9Y4G7_9EUKA|nr:hypothetical protein BLNAU_6338 [Blattamonas nauphoetae]